jgi:ABC-type uncharacterized transport system permease subunit
MGKTKKILLIIGILILVLGVPAGVFLLKQQTIFHLGAQSSNQPENVQVADITDQSATINWTTKSASQGLVSYGLSADNLTLIQPEAAASINHQVILRGLLAGSNYFFIIKADEKTFDNNGQPYSFTTKIKQISPTPTVRPLNEAGLEAAMGTANTTYDLNRDGIVNSLDLLILRQQTK